ETSSNPPSTASRERFVFPFSSSKILRPSIFLIIRSAVSRVSSCETPISTRKPFRIAPTVSLSTRTHASFTLCITNLIFFPPAAPVFFLLSNPEMDHEKYKDEQRNAQKYQESKSRIRQQRILQLHS